MAAMLGNGRVVEFERRRGLVSPRRGLRPLSVMIFSFLYAFIFGAAVFTVYSIVRPVMPTENAASRSEAQTPTTTATVATQIVEAESMKASSSSPPHLMLVHRETTGFNAAARKYLSDANVPKSVIAHVVAGDHVSVTSMVSLAAIRREGRAFVTFVSSSMLDFGINWFRAALLAGIRRDMIMVGALDSNTGDALLKANIPYLMVNGTATLDEHRKRYCGVTNCRAFRRMAPAKIGFIDFFVTAMRVETVVTDADVTWIRNPSDFLSSRRLDDADLLISSDSHDLAGDAANNLHSNTAYPFNTGQMVWRPTVRSSAFLKSWKTLVANSNVDWMRDQPALNILLKESGDFAVEWNEGIVRMLSPHELENEAYPRTAARRIARLSYPVLEDGQGSVANSTHKAQLRVGVLPIALFTNGHVFFVQHDELLRRGHEPLSMHATYQFGDRSYPYGKRQRLREAMLWHADDDTGYYDDNTEGFVRIHDSLHHLPIDYMDVNMAVDSRVALQRHFDEDRYRRRLIMDAAAIAFALNRTLIMPRALCYCDKTWHPIRSCWPYMSKRDTAFPFVCPLDHLYDIERLTETERLVSIKEHSFLDNPKTSYAITNDRVSVRCSAEDHASTIASGDDVDSGTDIVSLEIPCGISDVRLRHVLEKVENRRVLEFSTISGVLCKFSDARDQQMMDHFAERAMTSADTTFCSTEAYEQNGSPRREVNDIIKRHCGDTRADLKNAGRIQLGHVVNSTLCACEFGMTEIEGLFTESRRTMSMCAQENRRASDALDVAPRIQVAAIAETL